ncbi:MAG: Fe-S cluster assembly protein SufD [Prevotellaceae bacterium]|jgi:Fe-S cluster assembly protein SufD|nr:Fe-S cluster assembly protein SufD [Prevotellaceae bacterium]
MKKSYSYIPEIKHKFMCRVPLEGIRQSLLVDGLLQEKEGQLGQNQGFGVRWVVPAKRVVESPVQLISVRTPEHKEPLRLVNEWVIEDRAEAKLLVCDHTLSFDPFTTTQKTQIRVGKGARFELIVMQNEHNESHHHSDFRVDLEEDSFFRCTFVSLHGGQLENRIELHLDAPGASCEANGLFLADGDQRIDFGVEVQHNAPQCTSSQLFKGILDNRAHAEFEGVIKVSPSAQKTQAYQANHNLLLTHQSKIVTRPRLEIYADDVKCSHGATVGRLDQEALFYLRSRGIGLKEARIMQQLAFLHDVLAQITIDPLRYRLLDLVEKRLRGAFAQCGDCSMHCC